jgi:4-amino-4-deoxy-L-arabinose transferase-like glycosyltransferase
MGRVDSWVSRRSLVWLWIGAGVLLLALLPREPLQRSQEARVLVTARGMADGPAEDWLIPKMNGVLRLEKPPLAYWVSAVSFEMLGVRTWSGRLPMAIAAWATLGLVFAWGNHLAGRRAGLLAALALLGTQMFFRFARQAETDTLALPFVIGGLLALWRAMDLPSAASPQLSAYGPLRLSWQRVMWYHLAGLSTAMALLAKGGPAVYPVAFLLGSALFLGRRRALWDFVRSGAPLTAAVLGLPWFVYVWQSGLGATHAHEIQRLVEGDGHKGWFYEYIPELFVATAPWSLLVVWTLIDAVRQWRHTPVLRALLVAAGAILVPLLLAVQKQNHYLLPLLPVLTVMLAVSVERLITQPCSREALWARQGLRLSLIGILVAPVAFVIFTVWAGRAFGWPDAPVAAAVVIAAAVALRQIWTAGLAQIRSFAIASAVLVAAVGALWSPRMVNHPPAEAAQILHQTLGEGPFAFYETSPNLPLLFELGDEMPVVTEPENALQLAKKHGHLMLLYRFDKYLTDHPLPPHFQHQMDFMIEQRKWEVYAWDHQSP